MEFNDQHLHSIRAQASCSVLHAEILQVRFPRAQAKIQLVAAVGIKPPVQGESSAMYYLTFKFCLPAASFIDASRVVKPHLMLVQGRDMHHYSSEQSLKVSTPQGNLISECSQKLYFLSCLIL